MIYIVTATYSKTGPWTRRIGVFDDHKLACEAGELYRKRNPNALINIDTTELNTYERHVDNINKTCVR